MPRFLLPLGLIAPVALGACAMLPDFKTNFAKDQTAPVILPLDEVLAQADGAVTGPDSAAAVDARAARLRARAATLAGPAQDAETRARLQAAIAEQR